MKPSTRTDTELLECVIAYQIQLSKRLTWPHEPSSYDVVYCGSIITPDCEDPREAIGWALDWFQGDQDKKDEIARLRIEQWMGRNK